MSAELRAVAVSLVSIPRFEKALERRGERLRARLFSPDELAYAAHRRTGAHSLAARFAAKCAGRSALRSIGSKAFALRDFEVVRSESGEPGLLVRSAPEGLEFRLSLTHDQDFAVASLWVESERPEPTC